MLGVARHSPSARKVADIKERIRRLEEYELWANCDPLSIEDIVSIQLWDRYYGLQKEILDKMRDAQEVATEIAREIRSHSSAHGLGNGDRK
jgi:cell fate (sporulation/competence/biofilm development) regulator YlbF (YheA/YmcA/DUF963 family)